MAEAASTLSSRKRPATSSTEKKVMHTDEYTGYQPSAGVRQWTDRVSPCLTPNEFYQRFVQKRSPAVFDGHLVDEQWKGSQWTLSYLLRKAGGSVVTVEELPAVENKTDAAGIYLEMHYRDFLSALIAGETRYQLSNTDVQCSMSDLRDRSGLSTVQQPLQTLANDFPLQPKILGNLIPHQVALCQGHSHVQQKLGLHHYFHDCLYVLLRGRQRFRLFPPSTIPLLQSASCPLRIHSNGLAMYLPAEKSKQKAASIRADGVPLIGIARMKRDSAERNMIEAEGQVLQLRQAGAESNPALAQQLMEALNLMKDCELLVDATNDDLQRYYSDYEETGTGDDDVISIHDDDSEPEIVQEPAEKVARQDPEPDTANRVMGGANEEMGGASEEMGGATENMREYWRANWYNVSLARQNTDDADELFAECPQLKNVACLVVDLRPGEMLYLPASWLFEVTTVQDENKSTGAARDPTITSAADAVPGDTTSIPAADCSVGGVAVVTDSVLSSSTGVTAVDPGCSTGTALTGSETAVGVSSSQSIETHTETVSKPDAEVSEEPTSVDRSMEEKTADVSESAKTENQPAVTEEGSETVGQAAEDDGNLAEITAATEVEAQQPAVGIEPAAQSAAVDFMADVDYLALTYLLHPPDGVLFDRPYADEFWKCRWECMEAEMKKMLKKSSRLASEVISLGSSSSSSDYDSSDECEYSDEYDSAGNTSPIFLQEKRSATDAQLATGSQAAFAAAAEREIVLDENSSSAIVLADDDDDDSDIECSSVVNSAARRANDSVDVIYDADNSVLETDAADSSMVTLDDDVVSDASFAAGDPGVLRPDLDQPAASQPVESHDAVTPIPPQSDLDQPLKEPLKACDNLDDTVLKIVSQSEDSQSGISKVAAPDLVEDNAADKVQTNGEDIVHNGTDSTETECTTV